RCQCTLGQTTVTDFTTLRSTETTCFACRKWRHVVVHQETITILTRDRINNLLILLSTQRGHNQCLCFTTSEQSATVCTWQHAQTDFDRTNGTRITTVNSWLTAQDLLTNNFRLKVEQ